MTGREDFPALYQAADDYSIEQQKIFYRVLGVQLVLLILAGAATLIDGFHPWAATVQAILFFGILGLTVYLYNTKPDRKWYAARALAESVKTVAWRYVTRAEPFDTDEKAARVHLRSTITKIVEQNKEIAGQFKKNLDGQQLTQSMSELRLSSLYSRIDTYLNSRVSDQHKWYARKSQLNSIWARNWFIALVVLLLVGVGMALLRVGNQFDAPWPVDFVIASATAILTWTQAKRFSELSSAYSLAALEIGSIQTQIAEIVGEAEFSKFVGDAENAFSREHTQWAARKDS